MPYAFNGDVKLYWRESGGGDPLLLIMGLGYSSDMWHHVEPILAGHFRVIVFDNRGIGQSEAPPGPHLIGTMAEDALAVLDAAGVESAFVLGLSMGGFIAQELTLKCPRRVRALVLVSTTCGGEHAVAAEQEVLDTLMNRVNMPLEQSIQVMMPFIYDQATPVERLDADLAVRLVKFPSAEVYLGQLEGIKAWQGCERLSDIHTPTLILHGENDRLVPPANARILQHHIDGAHLQMIPNASHVITTDRPCLTAGLVTEFLQSCL